ncbi:MAG: 5-formyltetrahydrofolate cyclo-ligase [Rhodospirillaceae bacterium]|jgi:5-formyltetrahydrofolate cyclo-ligase|nr:5-formyltetrahydrofolate cyclo-ligase [Rhodospirillaceae bacterium]
MTAAFNSKSAARQHVWDALKDQKLARFPFPIHGRIPNFKGAEAAARRLFEIAPWKDAKFLKINPDSPQKPLREEALKRGIIYFMPTPRLKAGFMKFDPARIPPENFRQAAALSTCQEWAEEVPLEALPRLDAIVAGSVAVTRTGKRCGKGEGYSDIEFAILRELGHPPVPVATTVHSVQLVDDFPRDDIDLPLSVVVTPEEVVTVANPFPAPEGIAWDRLTDQDLDDMPVLRDLQALQKR